VTDTHDPSGVLIEAATLRWVGSVPSGCFLAFTARVAVQPVTLLEELHAAMAVTEEATSGDVRVAAVVPGLDAIYLCLAYDDAPQQEVRAWADRLARELTRAGMSGVLRRPLPQYLDNWVTVDGLERRAISVFYASREPIDAAVVERLAAAHGLDELPHHGLSDVGEVSLRVRYGISALAAIPAMHSATLVGWADDPRSSARIQAGSFTATGWTPRGDRVYQAERSRAAVTALAPDVHHAFADVTTGMGRFRARLRSAPNGISPTLYVQRRDWWPSRVLDAHGLQVLTAEHLDRASSLTDWDTRKVDDRYVVSARDLDPWFAEDESDPEVLSRARADFGQMIITRTEHDEALSARLEAAEQARDDTPSSDDGR
jgi:hypothetical protein